MKRPGIILKKGKEASLMRRHPWVFSGAIQSIEGDVAEGDLVNVSDHMNRFLGTGHYQPGSIAVRVLSFEREQIGDSFWKEKLENALALRRELGLAGSNHTSMYRLVHGEGDGLPGLVVDMYGKTAVMQAHTAGMLRSAGEIVRALKEIMGKDLKAVYNKSLQTLPGRMRESHRDGYLYGEREEGPFLESGLSFLADWEHGQKTGFYIDQRENRKLLEKLAAGRKVLNLFGYSGSFSVYALRGGARVVHTVDSSRAAIEMAGENLRINPGFPGQHEAFVADAMDFLKNTPGTYNLIVLDPPAYAKHGVARQNALQGYRRLNQAALEKIEPGGMLFTFSCSQVVSREQFRRSVFVAAATAGRPARILYQTAQPPDHPVSLYHPEGEYLKGLVLSVD
ncbi:MAG TPA: class I SAM-dependent rRNA methyltransferase [Bacteroidetes bacterium]|nr:class I SAM-dependent rRNA methyltransferase [Bacteroidota bacterium]